MIAWYALIGVMLGVATLIVVQAVMIGFREEFTDRILGANAHVTVYYATDRRERHARPADPRLRRAGGSGSPRCRASPTPRR